MVSIILLFIIILITVSDVFLLLFSSTFTIKHVFSISQFLLKFANFNFYIGAVQTILIAQEIQILLTLLNYKSISMVSTRCILVIVALIKFKFQIFYYLAFPS